MATNNNSKNSRHHAELIGHTLEHAAYGGHGYAVGKQGRRGHVMPPSDLHKQGGAHVAQGSGAGVTGQASGGGFAPGGASGSADYQNHECRRDW